MPVGLQGVGAGVDGSGWDEAAGNVVGGDEGEGGRMKTVQTLVHRLQKNVRIARDHAYCS
jgi:hypothetical protein